MKKLKPLYLFFIAGFFPLQSFCQNATANNSSYFSNPLFNTMLAVILFLAIIILSLSTVIKNVADSDFLNKKIKKDNEGSGNSLKAGATILFILSSLTAFSQNTNSNDSWAIGGLDSFTFYFMLSIILLEALVLGLMFYQFKFLLRNHVAEQKAKEAKETDIFAGLTGAVPVELEESILMDHDYDGIKELDNDLPPWWKYGFYLTIIVAVIYIYNYHFSENGALQIKEYETEMAQAKLEVEEYMKNASNMVDENTVTLINDAAQLEAAKEAYITSCAACHGRAGEGGVGPNLADEYWLHGGSIQEVFKSIKYGWVEKGMKAWKEDLSPMQIAQVTSFIMNLKGTNPPNGKAPQGDLYTEKGITVSDTLKISSDSLSALPMKDTLK